MLAVTVKPLLWGATTTIGFGKIQRISRRGPYGLTSILTMLLSMALERLPTLVQALLPQMVVTSSRLQRTPGPKGRSGALQCRMDLGLLVAHIRLLPMYASKPGVKPGRSFLARLRKSRNPKLH